jgi:glutaredoxin
MDMGKRAALGEEEIIDELIISKLSHGSVVMWTYGDSCIHSGNNTNKARQLLRDNQIEFTEIDLSQLPDSKQNLIKMALFLETSQGQFPNIYFGFEHVGGVDDLVGHLQNQEVF